jgi:hypothetical protein
MTIKTINAIQKTISFKLTHGSVAIDIFENAEQSLGNQLENWNDSNVKKYKNDVHINGLIEVRLKVDTLKVSPHNELNSHPKSIKRNQA